MRKKPKIVTTGSCKLHDNCWIFELLSQEFIKQSMFDPMQDLPGFPGDASQANPNKHRAGNMIALNPRLSALATLDACELLGSSMKLRDLPAQGTRLL